MKWFLDGLRGGTSAAFSKDNSTYRERSMTEAVLRAAAATANPALAATDAVANVSELQGHITGKVYEAAYQRNIEAGMDGFEAANQAFDTATDCWP